MSRASRVSATGQSGTVTRIDSIVGSAFADTINSKDGVGETVNCGDGTDSALVDAADQRTSCEAVSF